MPSVYVVRGDGDDYTQPTQEQLSKEEYSHMSNEQFILFARIFLKDKIMCSDNPNSWQRRLDNTTRTNMNKFFENIPEDLIDFSCDITKRLILKYITSNLRHGFGIDLDDYSINDIYSMITRLSEIDPRLGSIR